MNNTKKKPPYIDIRIFNSIWNRLLLKLLLMPGKTIGMHFDLVTVHNIYSEPERQLTNSVWCVIRKRGVAAKESGWPRYTYFGCNTLINDRRYTLDESFNLRESENVLQSKINHFHHLIVQFLVQFNGYIRLSFTRLKWNKIKRVSNIRFQFGWLNFQISFQRRRRRLLLKIQENWAQFSWKLVLFWRQIKKCKTALFYK